MRKYQRGEINPFSRADVNTTYGCTKSLWRNQKTSAAHLHIQNLLFYCEAPELFWGLQPDFFRSLQTGSANSQICRVSTEYFYFGYFFPFWNKSMLMHSVFNFTVPIAYLLKLWNYHKMRERDVKRRREKWETTREKMKWTCFRWKQGVRENGGVDQLRENEWWGRSRTCHLQRAEPEPSNQQEYHLTHSVLWLRSHLQKQSKKSSSVDDPPLLSWLHFNDWLF